MLWARATRKLLVPIEAILACSAKRANCADLPLDGDAREFLCDGGGGGVVRVGAAAVDIALLLWVNGTKSDCARARSRPASSVGGGFEMFVGMIQRLLAKLERGCCRSSMETCSWGDEDRGDGGQDGKEAIDDRRDEEDVDIVVAAAAADVAKNPVPPRASDGLGVGEGEGLVTVSAGCEAAEMADSGVADGDGGSIVAITDRPGRARSSELDAHARLGRLRRTAANAAGAISDQEALHCASKAESRLSGFNNVARRVN